MSMKSTDKLQQSIDELMQRHQRDLQFKREELEAISFAARQRIK